MAETLYNSEGGVITVSVTMEGPMNCGYVIRAYKPQNVNAFKKVGGTVEDPQSLEIDDISMLGNRGKARAKLGVRAASEQFVGSKYKLTLTASQDGKTLKEKDVTPEGSVLSKTIEEIDLQLIFIPK